MSVETLQFPIGQFIKPNMITKGHINAWIKDIEQFPNQIKQLTDSITDKQKKLEI